MAKKKHNKKSPSISRTITERKKSRILSCSNAFKAFFKVFPRRKTTLGICCFLLLILVIALTIEADRVYMHFQQEQLFSQKRQEISQKIIFWQHVIASHPDYRDAYLELGILEYQIKDFKSARKNIEKSLQLDPNYTQAREMEKILGTVR